MLSRRVFMQLVGAAGAIPGLGLFSEDSLLIGGGDHYVFTIAKPPLLRPNERAYHDTGDGLFFSTRVMSKSPQPPYSPSLVFQGEPVADPDPMVGFFLGATSLQESVKAQPRYDGEGSLFTIVYQPIMAMPLSDQGFYLRCEISQFYADKSHIVNMSDAVSNVGQVSIEAPSDIDLKMMNMLAEEVYQLGGVKRVGNIPLLMRKLKERRAMT